MTFKWFFWFDGRMEGSFYALVMFLGFGGCIVLWLVGSGVLGCAVLCW